MTQEAPHIPVLIDTIIDQCAPIDGDWLDGTFGAGGYTRALLMAGAERVIAVDRDPLAFELAADWAAEFENRILMKHARFSQMDEFASALNGIVLDLGVSSMQLDRPERGFSFMQDAPLDMRMSQEGQSAADLVNELSEEALADILFHYGEERASRRIARAIVARRPVTTTAQLSEIIEGCLPRVKPGQSHPATRSFQALRIAVNAEYEELFEGLLAAERALGAGGKLAVVTFHSIEDRMVKRFFAARSGRAKSTNRHAPLQQSDVAPSFENVTRKALIASPEEIARNPRARSAKLRIAIRTPAEAGPISASEIGMPHLPSTKTRNRRSAPHKAGSVKKEQR